MKKEWNIFFLLFDCVEVLDFSGPFDVFSMANFGVNTKPQDSDPDAKPRPCILPGPVFNNYTVSSKGGTITALHGLKIQTEYSFADCPNDKIDMLIVPGFPPQGADAFIKSHPEVIAWIAERCRDVPIVASVCVGALLVGAAGGFNGLQATTHHAALKDLHQIAPLAKIMPGARYVDNQLEDKRRVLSSAGVSAGIDLAFYILRYVIGGDKLALNTATIMEYNETSNWVFGVVDPVDWDSLRETPRDLPDVSIEPDESEGEVDDCR